MTTPSINALRRPVRTWLDLIKRQVMFQKHPGEWVFRGHSNETWELATTLERATRDFAIAAHNIPDIEIKLIHEFIRRFHLYTSEAPPKAGDTLEWLALMRHHGTPTRLLDFTFSFLVAAFFSLESSPEGNPTVWAINKTWLTKTTWDWARQSKARLASMEKLATLRDGAAFRRLFFQNTHGKPPKIACPISAFRMNQRLTVQQGVFLSQGDVRAPFMENLRSMEGHKANVLKIPILAKQRPDLLFNLDRIGLNSASLFPGLDGFARSLQTRILLLSRLQRMEQDGSRNTTNIGMDILDYW